MTDISGILRKSFIALIVLVAVLACFFQIFGSRPPTQLRSITKVLADAQAGAIARIDTKPNSNEIIVTYKDQARPPVIARLETNDSITELLIAAQVPLDSVPVQVGVDPWAGWPSILLTVVPVLVLLGSTFFLSGIRKRQQQIQRKDES
jgi:ATP-dependent Zn protease